MELPRTERRLPTGILSAQEAERVLDGPDVDDPIGLRDRAILELLYATAIRRSEVVKLDLGDVDCARGLLVVRQGKGKKDRLVPVGPRASAWLAAYVEMARPQLARAHSEDTLFLSRSGRRLAPTKLSDRVSGYVQASGLGKSGSCHLFRHTAATLMLEGGADIRFIQALLEHPMLLRQIRLREARCGPASTVPMRKKARGVLVPSCRSASYRPLGGATPSSLARDSCRTPGREVAGYNAATPVRGGSHYVGRCTR